MTNRLLAFGDSFTWGSELSDSLDSWDHTTMLDDNETFKPEHEILASSRAGPYSEIDHNHKITSAYSAYSKKTWPGLLADHLGYDYRCYANPGGSNQTIIRRLFQYLPYINNNDVVILNWTYISRWDFVDITKLPIDNQWETIRPTNDKNTKFEQFYFDYIQSELWDKWDSLKCINLAVNTLKSKNIKFMMTNIDSLVLDKEYHCSSYINNAQDEIIEYITSFEGKGFDDWCTDRNFPRGEKNNHPLEEAHIAAFEYMKDKHDFTK